MSSQSGSNRPATRRARSRGPSRPARSRRSPGRRPTERPRVSRSGSLRPPRMARILPLCSNMPTPPSTPPSEQADAVRPSREPARPDVGTAERHPEPPTTDRERQGWPRSFTTSNEQPIAACAPGPASGGSHQRANRVDSFTPRRTPPTPRSSKRWLRTRASRPGPGTIAFTSPGSNAAAIAKATTESLCPCRRSPSRGARRVGFAGTALPPTAGVELAIFQSARDEPLRHQTAHVGVEAPRFLQLVGPGSCAAYATGNGGSP